MTLSRIARRAGGIAACIAAFSAAAREPAPSLRSSAESLSAASDPERATTVVAAPSCCGDCRPTTPDAGDSPNRLWPNIAGLALGAGLGAIEGGAAGAGDGPGIDRPGVAGGAVAASVFVAGFALPKLVRHEPPACGGGAWRDCDVNGLDRWWRGVAFGNGDRARSFESRERLAALSDVAVVASGARPFAIVLTAGDGRTRWRDALLVAEAQVIQWGLVNGVKHVFHRPRPYARFCHAASAHELDQHDSRQSFYSGHTSTAFAGAMAAWEIARLRGYRNQREILWTGIGLATATGILRTTADRHYLTDVLVGAGVGGFVGWIVPRVHKLGPAPDQPAASRGDRKPVPAPQVASMLAIPIRTSRGQATLHGGYSGGPSLGVTWRF